MKKKRVTPPAPPLSAENQKRIAGWMRGSYEECFQDLGRNPDRRDGCWPKSTVIEIALDAGRLTAGRELLIKADPELKTFFARGMYEPGVIEELHRIADETFTYEWYE